MTTSRLALFLALALAPVLTAGCGGPEEAQIPEALPLAEAPKTLEEAFAGAAPEVQAEARQAAAFLSAGDYIRALAILQRLTALPELTGPQRELATRSMLTAQQEVAKAAESGDSDSQRMLRYRSETK